MNEMYLPWLELAIAIPVVGALLVDRQRTPQAARRFCLASCAGTLLCLAAGWMNLVAQNANSAAFRQGWQAFGFSESLAVLDGFNAPLLLTTALLFMLTVLATPRTKARRFSLGWTLISEALLLATMSTRQPWLIVALMALSTIPPWLELRARRKATAVYVWHMGVYVALLIGGWWLVSESRGGAVATITLIPLLLALFIRSGLAPFHCWMTDLFEHATFGSALLVATPMVGAYAMVQLVLPIASDTLLHGMGMMALASAGYAAGMALVQRDVRRFFCYVFLSHSALVFVGLESVTPIGLTGALCTWIAVALSMTGFGLTLRALEARHGRLTLDRFRGFYEHTPALGVCFLLTGLASVGFPGTLGFVGSEMLVDGAVQAYPYIGVAVVAVAAINGIAIMKAYFLLLTGAKHTAAVPLLLGMRERVAVLTLAALIIVGGLVPQPNVMARFKAAAELLSSRREAPVPIRHIIAPTIEAQQDNPAHSTPVGQLSLPPQRRFPG